MKNEIKNTFVGMKTKLLSLLVALCVTTVLWSQNNVITYEADEQLLETSNTYVHGLYINAFNVALVDHSFVNGTGTLVFDGEVTTIGDYAFEYCDGLTSVTIPNTVKSIGVYAFGYCTKLISVTIPNSVRTIGDYAFSGCSGLTSVTIPNSVITIGKSAFFGCISLTSVTIPNSVTTIGNDAFHVCSSLKSITLPNSITTIESQTFVECSALASIAIPSSVTTIEYGAFMKSGLTSIAISSSVNTIGNHAFEGCSNLPSISVDPANKHYSSLDGVLFNKTKDTLIQYPMGNVRTTYSIPNSVTTIVRDAFFDCTNLLSITIPNSVTTIGDNAFSSVNNIAYNGTATGSPWGAKCVNGYIDGNLVYSNNTKIRLCGCSSSTEGEITIPSSVIAIGDYAFYNCNSLTSITIPYSVKRIGEIAFTGCNNLTSITCYATTPPSCMYSFSGLNKTIPIYVPAQSVDAYKQADGWKDFTNILPIGDYPTRLENLTIDPKIGNKFLYGNQLYIRRGKGIYTSTGQKVK